jgi:ribokinase/sulfofructose kinase
LIYGDANADIVFTTTRIPSVGEKVLGEFLGVVSGGTVANAGCAASLLGSRVANFGRVGNDAYGEMLLESYRQAGVSDVFISVVPEPSATALVTVDANAERAVVFSGMSSMETDTTALSKALGQCHVVYTMPYDLDDFRVLSQLAHSLGVEVAVDIEAAVAPNRQRLESLIALSDIVFLNEGGWRASFDTSPSTLSIRPLLEDGPHTIVVTLGASGAIGCDRETETLSPAFPAKPVDVTGAGDCFNGAFLTAKFNDMRLPQALEFACAAASLSTTSLGARAALPQRGQVEALINKRHKEEE